MNRTIRASRHRDGMRRVLPWAALTLAAAAGAGQAQDGYYDDSWGVGGRLLVDVGPSADVGMTMAIQPDGKLLLGGQCAGALQGLAFCVVRMRPDGQLDLSFGPNKNGRILLTEQPGFPVTFHNMHGLAVQADGRILLTGENDFWVGVLARLSAAGHLEPTPSGDLYTPVQFSVHSSFPYNSIGAVATAPGGKIVVAGRTFRAGSVPQNLDFGVARFNADRAPDPGFGNAGIRLAAFDLGGSGWDFVNDVALQPDGKIVVVGYATGADGRDKAALLRLNADGSPDAGFGNNGRAWFGLNTLDPGHVRINAVAIDRQGRLIVAGEKQRNDSLNYDFMAARLDAQGQLDDSFGIAGGFVLMAFDLGGSQHDAAYDLALQSDGKILIVGNATADASDNRLFAVVRLKADGRHDSTFGIGGRGLGAFAADASDSFAPAISVGNGGIMVAGTGSTEGDLDRFGISKIRLDLIFTDGFP